MNLKSTFWKRKWLATFLALYGVFVLLPFAAPVLMYWKMDGLGRLIYFIYSFLCHQLPERSLFFFGQKLMYSISEIQTVWRNTDNPLLLRQFVGNFDLGWKVSWSDRMISLFGGIWIAGFLWGTMPWRAGRISIRFLVILALPLILDGMTHFVSDLSGLTSGFRYANDWLARLTGGIFERSFYLGDGIGLFNSWMRWVTVLLFSAGLVWWAFPYVDENFNPGIRLSATSDRLIPD